MLFKHSFFVLVLILTACRPGSPLPTATSTKIEDTETPSPTSLTTTSTAAPTFTWTATPPPLTPTIDLSLTPTLTPTSKPTRPTKGPGPGIIVRGTVKLAEGTAVEDVKIYVALASYNGTIAATTNSNGYYSSDYIFIPSDETVRVWAEAVGYRFKPAGGSAVWTGTEFYWRHYHGFEEQNLDFTAMNEPVVK